MPASSPTSSTFSRHLARLLPQALSSVGMSGLVDAPRQGSSQPDPHTPGRSTQERMDAYLRLEPEQLSPRNLRKLLADLQAIVEPRISEAEAIRQAQPFVDWYLEADTEARADAWRLMTEQFAPDASKVRQAKEQYDAALGTAEEAQAEIRLRKAFHSPRTRLLQRISATRHGMRFLLDLRTELMRQLKREPALLPLDAELEHLFTGWFDIGFLQLQTINWDSPASLIEKLIKYEAVHDIVSWDDAKNRLDHDRRCFAFFHQRLPNEPLIFVEVALVEQLCGSITPLLDEQAAPADLAKATTAIFYSISNTQTGLRGVSFGNSLIKHVVETLQTEFPRLRTFATLSPIPGFRAWLGKNAGTLLLQLPDKLRTELGRALQADAPQAAQLVSAVETADKAQALDAKSPVRQVLLHCAAHYLGRALHEGKPIDPVARFHLGNGARVERLNWAGDPSSKGLKQSFGLMVNYLYDLKRLDKHRTQLAQGQVPVSKEISALLLD